MTMQALALHALILSGKCYSAQPLSLAVSAATQVCMLVDVPGGVEGGVVAADGGGNSRRRDFPKLSQNRLCTSSLADGLPLVFLINEIS